MLATPQPSINQALWILDDNVLCVNLLFYLFQALCKKCQKRGRGLPERQLEEHFYSNNPTHINNLVLAICSISSHNLKASGIMLAKCGS
jgi:hypothetical protein